MREVGGWECCLASNTAFSFLHQSISSQLCFPSHETSARRQLNQTAPLVIPQGPLQYFSNKAAHKERLAPQQHYTEGIQSLNSVWDYLLFENKIK